jgi:hypothetical protein
MTDEASAKIRAAINRCHIMAEMICPADIIEWGIEHGIPEFARMTWQAGFQAAMRAMEKQKMTSSIVSKEFAEIIAERRRQIYVCGYTKELDSLHNDCALIDAASCYFAAAVGREVPTRGYDSAPLGWPWEERFWKPKDPHSNLVRAGALCLADADYWRYKYPESPPQALTAEKLRQIIAELERISGI